MNLVLLIIFNFSILVAGTIGVIRFPRITKAYHPFIYLIWAGCINSLFSSILSLYKHRPFSGNLLYDLCEAVFLIWFYRNIGVFQKIKVFFYGFIIVFICLFIGQSIWGGSLDYIHAYFTTFYSFCIVLLSINCINTLIFKEREIIKNASFLISIGTLVFYTYKGITELFWLFGLSLNLGFSEVLYTILLYLNLFCNLIYTLAIFRMRRKQPISLQY